MKKVLVEFNVEHPSSPLHAVQIVKEFLRAKGVVEDGSKIDREGKECHWGWSKITNKE